jgi:proteasome lid subunit RPN8/RPN11
MQLENIISEAAIIAGETGKEICGFLVDNGYFIEFIKAKNRIRKGGGFAFFRKEVRQIEAAVKTLGHEIVGTFHSHPLYIAKPSESDIISAVDDSLMMVIDVQDKKAALWHIKNNRIMRTKFAILG